MGGQVGYITKLPVREEKKAIEGGVERLILRTKLDRQGKWHYLAPKQILRKEEVKSEYEAQISKPLSSDLKALDQHKREIVRTRIKQIAERPNEIGEEKSGMLYGLRSVKFDGQSNVLLFRVDEKAKTVSFIRYGHHDVVYKAIPLIRQMEFIPLAAWLTSTA